MAAANGHAACVAALLSAGASPSPTNTERNTPLHYACLNGHIDVVTLLLAAGALATSLNAAERTPVDEALGSPHADAVLAAVRDAGGHGGDLTAADAADVDAAAEGVEVGEEEELGV